MTTTSTPSDTTGAGRIIPFPARDRFGPDAVAQTAARLCLAVATGDGHAMEAAMRQAREWWDAYADVDAATGGDGGASHLTLAWADLMEAVAVAPARSLRGLTVKAQLIEWNLVGRHGDAGWEPELARTLAAGLAELAANEAQ
jgi:hypothetical protein